MSACPSCGADNRAGARFCDACGAALAEAAPAREQRKTVTVLFCDVVGSTELGESTDPEALRALLGRYFERMSAIIERHGGSVEKFIGDAVMAVFGVPVVHEDDALRAVRAALEMTEAFPELGIQGRIGVTTGEVVTGTEERLATGDAVNVAARLEQAAQPGEALIGEETYRLTRDAVEVAEAQLLELKGKAKRVPAYRLLAVHGEEGFARRLDAPMVGRVTELRRLRDAFDQALSDRSCQLFTILGPAGVGKSRLAAEFLGSLGDAVVVRGRCLPYGEGITYWPVVEVVKQLPPGDTDPAAAETIRALLADEQLVSSSEEIAWAFRKRLEAVAAERPLVCVFDDLHWGEETFLDLVAHVADLSRDAPILLLGMARPELLDRRPGWAGGMVNATNVLLEPLAPAETERLIESLAHLDEGLRERVLQAAEGNPLFVEEMVALAHEAGHGDVIVPPTIQALLAARLDQLEPSERGVLERGAVEGRVFHRGAVQALAPEEPQVTERLTALVRKELVRPDKSQFPGEDAFRFRHLLIRDAAYDALPKATRADLHERFAAWLEEHGADLVELDEILGYHLEQATRYRGELGTRDEDLAARAADRLASAGRRAADRGDVVAWSNLLGRAVELIPPEQRQVALEVEFSDALFSSGRPREAERLLAQVETRAASRGYRAGELVAALARVRVLLHLDPEGVAEQLLALANEAIPVLTDARDDRGLARAWSSIAWVEHMACRTGPRNAAFEQALIHAQRAHEARLMQDIRVSLAVGYALGPTPAEEALGWYETELEAEQQRTLVTSMEAVLRAMLGRLDEARTLLAQTRERAHELGDDLRLATLGEQEWYVEMWAGDVEAAERAAREGCAIFEAMDEKGWQSTLAGRVARSLALLGRDDDAERWAQQSEKLGATDDVMTQMLFREARGRVLARLGDPERGERLIREAVALAETTDMLNDHADALTDLADVLELGGKTGEARDAREQALALYERKGNLVMAERTRARLERLV